MSGENLLTRFKGRSTALINKNIPPAGCPYEINNGIFVYSLLLNNYRLDVFQYH